MSARALVFGGTGYVGKALAARLKATGREVFVFSRQRIAEEIMGPGYSIVYGDLSHPDSLRRGLSIAAPTEVYSVAACRCREEKEGRSPTHDKRRTRELAAELRRLDGLTCWVRAGLRLSDRFDAEDEAAFNAETLAGLPAVTLRLFRVYSSDRPRKKEPSDWVHRDDVVEAFLAAAAAPAARGKLLEIGSGLVLPPGPGRAADVASARALLGWTPRKSAR